MRARAASPAVVALAALVAAGARGHAQPAPRLEGNDFALDVYRGHVTAPGRAVGLGGAFSSLAEGVEGVAWNAAALALRPASSLGWFDWNVAVGVNGGLVFGLVLPEIGLPRIDVFNTGRSAAFDRYDSATAGLGLTFGPLGVGYVGEFQTYVVDIDPAAGRRVAFGLGLHHAGAAWQLGAGELGLGAGARIARMSIARVGGVLEIERDELASYLGAGPEVGAIWRPPSLPVRLGLAWRSEVAAGTGALDGATGVVRGGACGEGGDARPGCYVLPRAVHLPWELQLGISYLVAARPFNPPWRDPRGARRDLRAQQLADRARREAGHARRVREAPSPEARAREQALWRAEEPARRAREDAAHATLPWRLRAAQRARLRDDPRHYLLVTFDLVLAGPTPQGQGVAAFVEQRRRPSGRDPVLSPRVGVEAEPWADRVRVRAGAYFEPSRHPDGTDRVHVTAGFDVRLFRWDALKLVDPLDVRVSATVDLAHDYFDWGVGVGFWR